MALANSFTVGGVEPQLDPAWHTASDAVKQAFWQQVVALVLAAKDKELAAGLDIFGAALAPIAEATRKKGRWRSHTGQGSAGNPPLTPALGLSRTRSLIAGRAYASRGYALFWWGFDSVSGRSWGEILGFHAAGAGRLPVRNVIGLSPDSLASVKAQALAWWERYKAGYPAFNESGAIGIKIGSKAPINVKLIGRTDLQNATFGIGGSEERTRKAIAAGLHSGFTSKAERQASRAAQAKAAAKPAAPKPVAPTPAAPKPVAAKPVVPKPVAPPKPAASKPVAPKPKPAPQVVPSPKPAGEAIPPKPAAPKPTPAPKPIATPAAPKPALAPAPVVPTPAAKPVAPPAPASSPSPAAWTPRKQSDFTEFTSGSAAEKWGQQAYADWAEGLTNGEKIALKLYASDNFKWMNPILNGADPATMKLPGGLSPSGALDYIGRAIAPLARGKTDIDITSFRGVRDLAKMGIDPATIRPGQAVTIKSFGSVSLAKNKAAEFANNDESGESVERKAIMQINMPAGSTGGYLNAGELSGYADEREILMPPGAELRFVRIGGVHKDVWGAETPVLVFERVK